MILQLHEPVTNTWGWVTLTLVQVMQSVSKSEILEGKATSGTNTGTTRTIMSGGNGQPRKSLRSSSLNRPNPILLCLIWDVVLVDTQLLLLCMGFASQPPL